jgi:hypothetical protein
MQIDDMDLSSKRGHRTGSCCSSEVERASRRHKLPAEPRTSRVVPTCTRCLGSGGVRRRRHPLASYFRLNRRQAMTSSRWTGPFLSNLVALCTDRILAFRGGCCRIADNASGLASAGWVSSERLLALSMNSNAPSERWVSGRSDVNDRTPSSWRQIREESTGGVEVPEPARVVDK